MTTRGDQSPEGPDPKGLDAKHASAGDAQRHAPNSPTTHPTDRLREAIARIQARVDEREDAVQRDRERAARQGDVWTDEQLSEARSWATVSSVSLSDLQALLSLPSAPAAEMATGLSSDLTAIVNRYESQPVEALAEVPVGLLRAALMHVNTFDASPLFSKMRGLASNPSTVVSDGEPTNG